MENLELIKLVQTNETVLWMLGTVSIVTFLLSLMLLPWLVARIPHDYFSDKYQHSNPWSDQHPLIRWALLIAKNLLGCIFVALGIVMLVLPGQGLLTIFIGMLFLNFPGKYQLQRWLAMRGPVRRSINWLRKRTDNRPLVFN